MEDSASGNHSSRRYEHFRSRPVTPAIPVKVSSYFQTNHPPEAQVSTVDELESLQLDDYGSTELNDYNYGLQTLGCKVPGISHRPLSAASRLGNRVYGQDDEGVKEQRSTSSGLIRRTIEGGDIIEMDDNYQKLQIARNQIGYDCGDGDGPSPLHQDDHIPVSRNEITIQSLSSKVKLMVPETHRNTQNVDLGPETEMSSGDETRVHPSHKKKSKLGHRKRKVGQGAPANTGGSLYRSLPDDDDDEERTEPSTWNTVDDDIPSDVGDNDFDYTAPSTAMSTMLGTFEMMRPETAATEILADGEPAEEKEQHIAKMMKCLGVPYDHEWYEENEESSEECSKNKLLQLVKLFYHKSLRASEHGDLYTHKLFLGGLHNRLEDFVLLPVPPGFKLKTRITRVKRGLYGRWNPIYFMHLEREGPGDRKCLLLVAKKLTKQFRGVGYTLSTDPAELDSKSDYCVGKISSNYIGTEFTLYGGRSICSHVPLEKGALTALSQSERFQEELVSVLYDPNVLGFKGPRKIKVVLPKMVDVMEREAIQPRIAEESMIYQYQNEDDGPIICLKNKEPIWNRESHSYILNFSGRVSTASVKNFQIVCDENEEDVLFQFGRASKNTFSLDFQYPFCPVQAFAIALSSFDSKLACE